MPDWLLPLILAPYGGSLAALRAGCRRRKNAISLPRPATGLACLAIAFWAVLVETDFQLVWPDCALGWTLLTLAWIDLQHLLPPDALTLALAAAGFTVARSGLPDAFVLRLAGRSMHLGRAPPFGPAPGAATWIACRALDPISSLTERLQ